MRVLVDTNIFLDFFLQRGQEGSTAKEFFYLCKKYRHQIFVSAMSLRDIGYIAQRYFQSSEKGKEIQRAVYSMCSKVASTTNDSAIDSLYSDVDDFEDSLQIDTAREIMADAIITNNKVDFKKSRVPAYTSREIVDIWNKCKPIIIE